MKKDIKVIAFDADDTLWSNEPYFQEVEKRFTELLTLTALPKRFQPHYSERK